MKRFLLLICLCITMVTVATAQKIYVNDVRIAENQLAAIPIDAIEKMETSVEKGNMVYKVILKANADVARIMEAIKAIPAKSKTKAVFTKEDTLTCETLRDFYEKSTLLKEGDNAVYFSGQAYNGENINLEQYRGKVILLQFWATWCGPCLQELYPSNLPEHLQEFVDNKDFVFVPVAYTNSAEDLNVFFASEKGQDYHHLKNSIPDPKKKITSIYAERNIPRSVVIGKDGVIKYGSVGHNALQTEFLVNAIRQALK